MQSSLYLNLGTGIVIVCHAEDRQWLSPQTYTTSAQNNNHNDKSLCRQPREAIGVKRTFAGGIGLDREGDQTGRLRTRTDRKKSRACTASTHHDV